MIGELQIIFRVHPIAGHLGVARQIAIFFEKLRRIAPCAAVDPVARIAVTAIASAPLARVIPTATATGLMSKHLQKLKALLDEALG